MPGNTDLHTSRDITLTPSFQPLKTPSRIMPLIRLGSPLIRIVFITAIPVFVLVQILTSVVLKSQQSEVQIHHANEISGRIDGILESEIRSTERSIEALSARLRRGELTPPEPVDLAALRLDIVVMLDDSGNRLWMEGRGELLGEQLSNLGSVRNMLTVLLSRGTKTGLYDLGRTFSIVSAATIERNSPIERFQGRLIGFRLLDLIKLARVGQVKGISLSRQRIISQSALKEIDQSWRHTSDGKGTLTLSRLIAGIALNDIFNLSIRDSDPTEPRYSSLLVSINTISACSCILITIGVIIFGNRLIIKPIEAITYQLEQQVYHNTGEGISDPPFCKFLEPLTRELNKILASRYRAEQTAAHASQIAQGAIDSRIDYVVSISHDVRSPLNAILGIAQILERMSLPIHLREYIHVLKDSGNTLHDLINDMLDYSSIETGQITFEQTPVDVRELISNAASTHAHTAFRKNVELVVDICRNAPTHIEADRLRIKQILVTLIENAITNSESGEVIIKLSSEPLWDSSETRVVFSIKDGSLGIPSHQHEDIFESCNKTQSDGLGTLGRTVLSLPIVRGLARGMGGDVWVESTFGQGATFHFELTKSSVSWTKIFPSSADTDSEVLFIDPSDAGAKVLQDLLSEMGLIRISRTDVAQLALRLEHPIERPLKLFLDARAITAGLAKKLEQLSGTTGLSWYVLLPPHLTASADSWLAIGAQNIIPKPLTPATFSQYVNQPLLHPEQTTEDHSPRTATAPQGSQGLSVLVVDDIESNQFILASLLEGWGHTVTTASSGIEAINVMRDRGHFEESGSGEPFDLIFMDIQMPKINGIETTRMIRASERISECRHAVPIIAVTADAQVKDIDEYVCVGMWGAVTKPILALRLFGIIESLGLPDNPPTIFPGKDSTNGLVGANIVAALELRSINFSVSRLWNDLGYDWAKLRDILESFVIEAEKQLSGLSELVVHEDYAGSARLAHALRGVLLNIGALGPAKIAASLEVAAERAEASGVRDYAKQLEESTRSVISAVVDALRSQTTMKPADGETSQTTLQVR